MLWRGTAAGDAGARLCCPRMSVDAHLASFSKSLKCRTDAVSAAAAGAAADTAPSACRPQLQVTASPRAIALAAAAQARSCAPSAIRRSTPKAGSSSPAQRRRPRTRAAGPWRPPALAAGARLLGRAVDPQHGLLPLAGALRRAAASRPAPAGAGHRPGLRRPAAGAGRGAGPGAGGLGAAGRAGGGRPRRRDRHALVRRLRELARAAGRPGGADEFVFSEAHADYAGAAWQAGAARGGGRVRTRYAMRACDITQHAAARRRPGLPGARHRRRARHASRSIGEALAGRPTGGGALPMHCDAVVASMPPASTRRRQRAAVRHLAPAGLCAGDPLARPQLPDRGLRRAAWPGCVDRHMSRQPWSLLLQWR